MKEGISSLLNQLKLGIIQNSGAMKEVGTAILDNPKVQGSYLFGTIALSQVDMPFIMGVFSVIGSMALTVRLYYGGAKSKAEKEKIDLEIKIMQAKEDDRLSRIALAENNGIALKRTSDTD